MNIKFNIPYIHFTLLSPSLSNRHKKHISKDVFLPSVNVIEELDYPCLTVRFLFLIDVARRPTIVVTYSHHEIFNSYVGLYNSCSLPHVKADLTNVSLI